MTDRLDEIAAKLRSGQDITHDEAADLFELTMIGNAMMIYNGLTRNDIVARLRARFPDAAALGAHLRPLLAAFDDMQLKRKR
jgi:hypothetical protein